MRKKIWTFLKMTALLFFSYLMLNITVPYLSLKRDESFLQIKQWIIDNNVWRVAFFTHVFSSVFLLLAGFTQFFSPVDNRLLKTHRLIGKIYILIILFISGPAGLIMSWYADGGILSQVAFLALCTLWIFTTAKAWQQIMNGRYVEHGNYMIRSYALTLSAITLRAWKYVIVLLFHPHPTDVYMTVAWLGWVPQHHYRRDHYKKRLRKTCFANRTANVIIIMGPQTFIVFTIDLLYLQDHQSHSCMDCRSHHRSSCQDGMGNTSANHLRISSYCNLFPSPTVAFDLLLHQ